MYRMYKVSLFLLYLYYEINGYCFNIQYPTNTFIKSSTIIVRRLDSYQEISKLIHHRYTELQGIGPEKYMLELKLKEYLSSHNSLICFVANDLSTNEMKGSCEIILNKHCNAWYLRNLFTLKTYQRQGVATELLSMVISHIHTTNYQKLYLDVHKDNHQAMKFYKKLGFQETKQLKFFWNRIIQMHLE